MKQNFKVIAIWDPEVGVFSSASNTPGLVVEAVTIPPSKSRYTANEVLKQAGLPKRLD
jgi:hypothetical protein